VNCLSEVPDCRICDKDFVFCGRSQQPAESAFVGSETAAHGLYMASAVDIAIHGHSAVVASSCP